jgi:cell division ATPase FtsA
LWSQYREVFKNLRKSHPRPKTIDALQTLVSKNVGFSLFREIERVKRELTDHDKAELHFIYQDIQIHEIITKAKFERLIEPELAAVAIRIQQVLADAHTQPSQIERVLRTGGSSLVPSFVQILNRIFGAEKIHQMDPLMSVVGGLGIIAHEDGGMRGIYRRKYRSVCEQLTIQAQSKHPLEVYTPQVGSLCYVDRETFIRKLPVELCASRSINPAVCMWRMPHLPRASRNGCAGSLSMNGRSR